jgi:hypothetical protein
LAFFEIGGHGRKRNPKKKRDSFKTERTTKLNWTAEEGTMDEDRREGERKEGKRRRSGGKEERGVEMEGK